MSTSAVIHSLATGVEITNDALRFVLADVREVSAPLAWFPRLLDAASEQRNEWRLIGGGVGLNCLGVDEDISVASLLRTR